MSGDTLRSDGSWRLSIDFGTSYTAAACERSGRITSILFDGSPRIPSVVAIDDHGAIVVGAVAEREMARAPERAERCPKQRIGDAVMLLGSVPVSPVDAVAAVLRYVFDEAVHQSGGARPGQVVLTHPARWGSVRLGVLAEAARRAGMPEPEFVSEPVAAAAAESQAASLGDGQVAAVFDLGGGTFDTAVVRRVGDRFEVIGPPGGNDRVGGETFDERVFVHLGELLAQGSPEAWEHLRFNEERTWRRAAFDFRTAARAAKEALSTRVDIATYLGAPIDAELRLTRDELERLIAPDLHLAVAELAATVEAAGVSPSDLRSVFLVGGSSRIPLASRLVGEWFGRVPITWGDPKGAVVLGALMVGEPGRRRLAGVPPTVETPLVAVDPADGFAPPTVAVATMAIPVSAIAAAATAPAAAADAGGRSRRRFALAGAAAAVLLIGGTVLAFAIGSDRNDGPSAVGSTATTLDPTTLTTTSDTTGVSSAMSSTTAAMPSTTTATSATSAVTTVPSTTSGLPSTTLLTTSVVVTTVSATTVAPLATATPTATTVRPTSTTVRPTSTTTPTAAATTTAAPITAAPATTTPPTVPQTTAAPALVDFPDLRGYDAAAAKGALQDRGLVGYVPPGACAQRSIITSYSPTSPQQMGTTITLRCE